MTNISPPAADPSSDVPMGERRANGAVTERAGRIAASRRWERSATGNPTMMYNDRRIVVVRHESGRYAYTVDRVWGRGCWASEGEAKRAAVMALLGLPRKPRHRPARADRAGLTGWRAARVESGGRDDDAVYDVYDDGDAAEQSEERNFA